MKLSLLEDGVLDYKGDGAVLATPNAVPVGSMGGGVKSSPQRSQKVRSKLEQHIKDCPNCSDKLPCDRAELLTK